MRRGLFLLCTSVLTLGGLTACSDSPGHPASYFKNLAENPGPEGNSGDAVSGSTVCDMPTSTREGTIFVCHFTTTDGQDWQQNAVISSGPTDGPLGVVYAGPATHT